MAFPTELFKNEVLYDVTNGVATITLNAPERMNTMGGSVNAGVQVALDLAEGDDNVQVSCVLFVNGGIYN
jgi:enoyl-CoA hydratase/carnithine racemase